MARRSLRSNHWTSRERALVLLKRGLVDLVGRRLVLTSEGEQLLGCRVKLIDAVVWSDTLGMLERMEIHFGQSLRRPAQSSRHVAAQYDIDQRNL